MRSLLLILAALPLASFALIINRNNGGPEDPCNNNGTTSNQYRLQRRHKGKTFFKYAGPRLFSFPPRAELFGQRMGFLHGSRPHTRKRGLPDKEQLWRSGVRG